MQDRERDREVETETDMNTYLPQIKKGLVYIINLINSSQISEISKKNKQPNRNMGKYVNKQSLEEEF